MGGGGKAKLFNGDRVSGLQDEKVMEICFTMMGRYLTLLNYTLKNGYDIENRLVVAKGEGVGGGMEWEVEVSRCKLVYIEWINNKALLYSTENYIQYSLINHNGKEY